MNRQYIALAICFFAIRYVISREMVKFLFCVIIASLFHLSATPFFIVYFLDRRVPKYIYLSIFIFAFMLNPVIISLGDRIISALPGHSLILERLRIRILDAGNITETLNPALNVILGLIKRIVIFLAIYLNLEELKEKIPSIKLMLNIYFISILIYVVFNNTIQTFVGRGSLYFGSLVEVFLLPCLIFLFKKKSMIQLVYAFVVLIMVMNAFRSTTVDLFTPYKGIFINTEYIREMQ